jgi:hypothetical protein
MLGEPNSVWEMHVSNVLQNSLQEEAKSSFLRVDNVVALKDATWLVSEYKSQSSLQVGVLDLLQHTYIYDLQLIRGICCSK